MHLEADQIQRVLHGELGGQEGDVTRHLSECAQCRHRVDEARQEEQRTFDLLRRLDHPAPVLAPDELAVGGRWLAMWGKRAAGIVLALGVAGAAYAAPGSPLPRWVEQVAERIRGTPSHAPETPPAPPAVAGIAVTPGERFTIAFAEPQVRGEATVSLTDGRDVSVRARGGVATFTSGADELSVTNRGSVADYEIELPRGAGRIEIRVGSRRVLLQENGRVVIPAAADSLGRYRLNLSPGSH
jgi:hypothetical protein